MQSFKKNKTNKYVANKLYKVFYRLNDEFYTIQSETDTEIKVETVGNREFKTHNYFEIFKGYEHNLEGLQQFYHDFDFWCKELSNENINYNEYKKHTDAVYLTLLRYSTKNLNAKIPFGIEGIEDINVIEYQYYEKCNNGGLISVNKEMINKLFYGYGKDYSSFYPNMLANSDLLIPIQAGKQSKVIDYKKQLKFGIYHCQIVSENPQFKQLFAFSKYNYYTHYSINFCLKYQKKFDIDITILGEKDEYNCLVYEKEDLVRGQDLFGDWLNKLIKIKTKYPDNKLAKHLLSSAWGILIQFNRTIITTDKDYAECDISYLEDNNNTKYKLLGTHEFLDENYDIKLHYEVVESKQPYKKQFRIKPFLTSYCRKYFAEFLINNVEIEDIVRITVDSVILQKDYDFTHLKYYPISEAKSTGKLKLKNVMDVKHYCNCGFGSKYKEFKNHKCSIS